MTDTELKARWEKLGRDRANGSTPDLDHEERTIRREWEEIQEKWRSGTPTDTTRSEVIMKVVRDLMNLHGVRGIMKIVEAMRHRETLSAIMWAVQVACPEQPDSPAEQKWCKVMARAQEELRELPYFYATVPVAREFDDGFGAIFVFDARVWNGPPRK